MANDLIYAEHKVVVAAVLAQGGAKKNKPEDLAQSRKLRDTVEGRHSLLFRGSGGFSGGFGCKRDASEDAAISIHSFYHLGREENRGNKVNVQEK